MYACVSPWSSGPPDLVQRNEDSSDDESDDDDDISMSADADIRLGEIVAQSVGLYALPSSSALHISHCAEEHIGHSAADSVKSRHPSLAACSASGIRLPKIVTLLLANPVEHSIPCSHEPNLKLLVADLGATDQLIPDVEAFYRYKRVYGLQCCMSDNSPLPVLGQGIAVIKMN